MPGGQTSGSVAIQSVHDGINRLTEAQYNTSNAAGYNQTRTSYTYDGGNRPTGAQDSQGTGTVLDTVSATYDGLNDLLTDSYASSTLNATVTYTYDNDQNRKTMTAGSQAQTTYTYDNDNRLTAEARGTQSVGVSYDADSRRTTLTLPNGVTVGYGYDADSHATGITYSSTGGGTLGNLTYGYDNDGRVATLGGSLATVNLPSAMTATYDAGNQLATWNGTAATTDGNGNLLSDPSIPGNTYTWNERNQLSSATAGGVQSSYLYDALGRRVGQTTSGLTAQYVYDMLNVAQEQYTGGTVADMLPGLGLDQNFARTDSSGSYAMLADLLGSTIGLVNSSGAIATGYQYGPFGQTTTSGTSSTNPIQYTGREMDATGLYFLRARYYNPIAQRFISPDPIGLLGGQADFYTYVFNQPMDWTDGLGLISFSVANPGSDSSTCVVGCGDSGGAPPPAIEALPSNGMNSGGSFLLAQYNGNTREIPQQPTPSATATPNLGSASLKQLRDIASYLEHQVGLSPDAAAQELVKQGASPDLATAAANGAVWGAVQATPLGWGGPSPAVPSPVPPVP